MPYYQLDDALVFPDPKQALDDPNGLLAIGGDLRPERLILAYQNGIFPWYNEGDPICWWSPDPRYVFKPDQIHINRSLAKTLRNHPYTCTINQAFEQVIRACADRPETWISEEMIQAYCQLHQLGWAHSVEVWHQAQLVGGLYGIDLGHIFCGESMFSHVPNASKIALCNLAKTLHQKGYELIDAQIGNPFLSQMGAFALSREQFLQVLRKPNTKTNRI